MICNVFGGMLNLALSTIVSLDHLGGLPRGQSPSAIPSITVFTTPCPKKTKQICFCQKLSKLVEI